MTALTVPHKSVQLLELWSQGMNSAQIAKHLNLPANTIASRLRHARMRLGALHIGHAVALAMASGLIAGPPPVPCVAVPDRRRRSLPDFAEAYKILHSRGLTQRQIAIRMGVKHKTVGMLVVRARKAGLLPPSGRKTVAL